MNAKLFILELLIFNQSKRGNIDIMYILIIFFLLLFFYYFKSHYSGWLAFEKKVASLLFSFYSNNVDFNRIMYLQD